MFELREIACGNTLTKPSAFDIIVTMDGHSDPSQMTGIQRRIAAANAGLQIAKEQRIALYTGRRDKGWTISTAAMYAGVSYRTGRRYEIIRRTRKELERQHASRISSRAGT